MKLNKILILSLFAGLALTSCSEKTYHLELLATNDLHGSVLSREYTSGEYRPSLSSAYRYVDSIRSVYGESNVMLVDCGDVLQGDNATYYYNFEDTASTHIIARAFNFMGYDAAIPGNHDFEAGHEVYDRLAQQLKMPYIAANAYNIDNESPYFQPYAIIKKGGLKIAVIGITNANVKSFISPDKYSGIDFTTASEITQRYVNEVRMLHRPDLVILAIHCGIGDKDIDHIENNAQYLATHIRDIDAVLAAHDHRFHASVMQGIDGEVAVAEAGSYAKAITRISFDVTKKGRKVISKVIEPKTIDLRNAMPSAEYEAEFEQDYNTVYEYSNRVIGNLAHDLDLSFDSRKRSTFLSMIHYVQLSVPEAEISITAPLVTSGSIPAGPIRFNDLFTLYRFENLLYIIKMSGAEVKSFLEAAYDSRIGNKGPMYNFDSAGGLIYTVDSTKPYGERINIVSMADGTPYDMERIYNVAMTSYRASGAGGLLKAAGIDPGSIEDRLVQIYPEIRMMLHQFIQNERIIDVYKIAAEKKIGNWSFVR